MKTNFLNTLKQGLFLLIAVLGTFVGFSQSTQNPTIGGSKTPGDIGGLLDIGGGKSSDGGLGQMRQFGELTTKTQCNFAYLNDIGGGGKGTSGDTGQVDFPDDFDDLDTGGKGTSTDTGQYATTDIGGRTTGGELTNPGTDPFDIGGRSTEPTIGFTFFDIGGSKSSTGGLEIDCLLCPDTGGGNGGKSTTGEFALSDIGGRDSGGGYLPFGDIGGRGDTGTGFIFDTEGRTPGGIGFNEDDAPSKLSKIE